MEAIEKVVEAIKLCDAGKINRIFFSPLINVVESSRLYCYTLIVYYGQLEFHSTEFFTSMVSTPRKAHLHTRWVMLRPESCGPSC